MSLLNQNLQAFMAIIETSTVHGAAKKIGLSQTGVTQRIRSLESSLNVTLFTRSRKGMLLTDEGIALQQYCQRAIELEGEVFSKIQNQSQDRAIRINITSPSTMMRSSVIPEIVTVLDKRPNIAIHFNVADNSSGVLDLKQGKSDLAIVFRHEVAHEFDSKLLKKEEYILVAPYSWRNIPLKEIIQTKRIIDFHPEDECTINYLKKYNLDKHICLERHFINNIDALCALIMKKQGYSVLSKKFAAPFLKDKKIVDINPGKSLKIDFALTWYPRKQMPAYCLLYTSPSPRDRTRSRMPSSA